VSVGLLYTFVLGWDMCSTISIRRKGSLLFLVSSVVKLTEGWLLFSADRNASAASMLGIMLNVTRPHSICRNLAFCLDLEVVL